MTAHTTAQTWAAVVLSGGGGARLGGVDKAAIGVDGPRDTLLERALAAVSGAAETVVVGPPARTSRPVRFSREDPPGSGPAAALLHGVDVLEGAHPLVLVLAVDMPLVTGATATRLLAAVGRDDEGEIDGAVLHDGRRQPLCAAYRTASLLAAAPAPHRRAGMSVRTLVAGLHLVDVPALSAEASDVDEWDDLVRIREHS